MISSRGETIIFYFISYHAIPKRLFLKVKLWYQAMRTKSLLLNDYLVCIPVMSL